MAQPKTKRPTKSNKVVRSAPTLEDLTKNNLQSGTSNHSETEQLNLKVPKGFKKEFKIYSASKDMSMNEYVQKAHEYYKQNHGL